MWFRCFGNISASEAAGAGKHPSTHLLLASSPVLLLVVAVGQFRILIYQEGQLTSFETSEQLHTCAACAEDPLVPASRQLVRSSRAPPLDRTSHPVHHRSAAVQLQRLLSRLLTFCKELELCLSWTGDRNCIRWSSDQERDNSAPTVNVTTSKPWPPRR
jgi:hypothetical protein